MLLFRFIPLLLLYFLPTIIAFKRGSPHLLRRFLENTLFGWTVIAWLALLYESASESVEVLEGAFEDEHIADSPEASELRKALKSLVTILSAEHKAYLETALFQLSALARSARGAEVLLAAKISTEELTYARYMGVISRLEQSILDNLNGVSSLLKSISSFDTQDSLAKRMLAFDKCVLRQKLQGQNRCSSELPEIAAQERYLLISEQESTISDLLTENETAITALNRLCAQWAKLGLVKGRVKEMNREVLDELSRILPQVECYGELYKSQPKTKTE